MLSYIEQAELWPSPILADPRQWSAIILAASQGAAPSRHTHRDGNGRRPDDLGEARVPRSYSHSRPCAYHRGSSEERLAFQRVFLLRCSTSSSTWLTATGNGPHPSSTRRGGCSA